MGRKSTEITALAREFDSAWRRSARSDAGRMISRSWRWARCFPPGDLGEKFPPLFLKMQVFLGGYFTPFPVLSTALVFPPPKIISLSPLLYTIEAELINFLAMPLG